VDNNYLDLSVDKSSGYVHTLPHRRLITQGKKTFPCISDVKFRLDMWTDPSSCKLYF
jgi:hypothetical protein